MDTIHARLRPALNAVDRQAFKRARDTLDVSSIDAVGREKWFSGVELGQAVADWLGRPVCIFHPMLQIGEAVTYLPYSLDSEPEEEPAPLGLAFMYGNQWQLAKM